MIVDVVHVLSDLISSTSRLDGKVGMASFIVAATLKLTVGINKEIIINSQRECEIERALD